MTSYLTPRGNYRHYTLEQKKNAVQLGNETTFGSASEQLKIPKSTILTWKKEIKLGTLGVVKKNSRLTYSVQADLEIRDWVLQQRENQIPVTRSGLADYARKKVNKPEFQAKEGWLRHFLRRHNLSLRAKTTVSQQLAKDLEAKIGIFRQHLIAAREETKFDYVINMDETSVQFDNPPARTIHGKGQKSVPIRTTGAEKKSFTVVLGISDSGQTLPPFVVFKGKRWPKELVDMPNGVHVRLQENGWMSENLMIQWLDNVIAPYTENKPTLLIMDSFSGHTTPAVMTRLEELNVTPVIIPGGCTSKLQPLDVSINKPFKDRLRALWLKYMESASIMANGKIATPSRNQMLNWITQAWSSISEKPETIIKSFKVCAITEPLALAATSVRNQEAKLMAALDSDESDGEFEGFTEAAIPWCRLYLDSVDPFLDTVEQSHQ